VDLAVGFPFRVTHKWLMDLPLVLAALVLGYLGWATLREQD
jgi:hypothetical protein